MLQKTKAIVISSIKYSDNSLIVSCYTENFGLKSYLLKGVLSSKRGKLKKSYFQLLTQLDLITYHNTKGHLNSIREANISYHYQSLHIDIVKQSLVLFLGEVLRLSIKEEDTNTSLYKYLETALMWLDTHSKIANFHILFLFHLTKYLGFYPELDLEKDYFNLLKGKSTDNPNGKYTVKARNIYPFQNLLGTDFDALPNMDFDAKKRGETLDVLIQYISLHLPTFKMPKSLAVLQTIHR